jgi:dTDP-4-amino-4,6-dideoxygalactose transaminase
MMSIRVHGQGIDKYDNVRIGINGRLDTLQAAILLAKLEIFEEEIRLRQEVAQSYNRMLNGHVTLPFVKEGNMSVWAQYSVLHHERTEKMTVLKEHNIPTAIYYPKPLHLQRAFSGLGYQEGCFPVAERVSTEIFSLPMHPHLTVQEQELIARSLSGGIG